MKIEDFDYHLPKNLIAQEPIRPRDHSRLLILDKQSGCIEHKHFYDLPQYLQSGDILVVNNSKVFPARLIGKKAVSGGQVEIFLLRSIDKGLWQCLVKGRNVNKGTKIIFKQSLVGELIDESGTKNRLIRFNLQGNRLMQTIFKIGLTPLPPYIKREDKKRHKDKIKYQTIYADNNKVGSVAAPTAGFHFTPNLIKILKKQGVSILPVTLHVGLGTFLPVTVDNLKSKSLHQEWLEVSNPTLRKIKQAKKTGKRIVAVGTTSVRSLETVFQTKNLPDKKFSGWTNIFIFPGFKFKVTDAMITNFHLPKSSLIMLVSALARKNHTFKAYREAVKRKYRFYSYGDAMLIK